MSVSQVKNGFLFPRWQQLLHPVASWNFFLPVATDDFMEKYCAIMTKCFSTCLHGIVRKADAWTSHGMRRTGILIKIMGGGNDLAVCNSAGLESVGTLKHYVDTYDGICRKYRADARLKGEDVEKFIPEFLHQGVPMEFFQAVKWHDGAVLQEWVEGFQTVYPEARMMKDATAMKDILMGNHRQFQVDCGQVLQATIELDRMFGKMGLKGMYNY